MCVAFTVTEQKQIQGRGERPWSRSEIFYLSNCSKVYTFNMQDLMHGLNHVNKFRGPGVSLNGSGVAAQEAKLSCFLVWPLAAILSHHIVIASKCHELANMSPSVISCTCK